MCLVAAASAQVHPIGRRASAEPGKSFIPKFVEVFRNASIKSQGNSRVTKEGQGRPRNSYLGQMD